MAFSLGEIFSTLKLDITSFLNNLGKAAKAGEAFQTSFAFMGETARKSLDQLREPLEGATEKTGQFRGATRLATLALSELGVGGVGSFLRLGGAIGAAVTALLILKKVGQEAFAQLQRGAAMLSNDLSLVKDRASAAWEAVIKSAAVPYYQALDRLLKAITQDLRDHGAIWAITTTALNATASVARLIANTIEDIITAANKVKSEIDDWLASVERAEQGMRKFLGGTLSQILLGPSLRERFATPQETEKPQGIGRSTADIQRAQAAAQREGQLLQQTNSALLQQARELLDLDVLAAQARGKEVEAARLQAAIEERLIALRGPQIAAELANLAKQKGLWAELGILTAEVNADERARRTAGVAAVDAAAKLLQMERQGLPVLREGAALQGKIVSLMEARAVFATTMQREAMRGEEQRMVAETLGEKLRLDMSMSRLQVQRLGLGLDEEARRLGEMQIREDEEILKSRENALENQRDLADDKLREQEAAAALGIINKQALTIAQAQHTLELSRIDLAAALLPLARAELAERLKLLQATEAITAARQLSSSLKQAAQGFIDELVKGTVEIKGLLEEISSAFIERAIGQSLNKMIDQLVSKLEKGLEGLFGQSGALWMGVIGVAVAGISSFLKDTSAKVESLGDDLQGGIEDIERTRGLLAGQTTIQIAQLSQNLSMAFRPTESLLGQILQAIRQQSGQAGGPPIAAGFGGYSFSVETLGASRL